MKITVADIPKILDDPSVHNLTKETIRKGLAQDPVDAYFDVRLAAEALEAWMNHQLSRGDEMTKPAKNDTSGEAKLRTLGYGHIIDNRKKCEDKIRSHLGKFTITDTEDQKWVLTGVNDLGVLYWSKPGRKRQYVLGYRVDDVTSGSLTPETV